MTSVSSPSLGTDAISALQLDPAWYDAIGVRRSRRRYSDRKVAKVALSALQKFCREFRLAPGGRVVLVEDHSVLYAGLLDRGGGGYGRVEGAPWMAAFMDLRAARSRSATSVKPSSLRRLG